ncbi:hypothetical protein LCGC14_1287960 [marine sediment metagenome]|uniref:Uncharacterized protein n=1 Tax=marine sediment metagenome TaxID=412755 RepID=A0A0F9KTB9_9ZZZZ
MKFRINFVSNSSSTSFIVIGKRIHRHEITQKMINQGIIYGEGKDWSDADGLDFFRITRAMMTLCLNRYPKIIFWKVDKLITDEETFSKNDIENNTITVIHMEASNHSSNDLEIFKERYIN